MGPASEGLVARAQPALMTFGQRLRADESICDAMDDWQSMPEEVATGTNETGLASRFLATFWKAGIPETAFYAAAETDAESETWDLAETPQGREYRAAFIAAKGVPPMAVLFAGLGPQRAGLLPGTLGLFALSPEDTATAADTIRKTHALPPQPRADAQARMMQLVRTAGAPAIPVNNLLDALVVVVASAVSRGEGLISVTMTG